MYQNSVNRGGCKEVFKVGKRYNKFERGNSREEGM